MSEGNHIFFPMATIQQQKEVFIILATPVIFISENTIIFAGVYNIQNPCLWRSILALVNIVWHFTINQQGRFQVAKVKLRLQVLSFCKGHACVMFLLYLDLLSMDLPTRRDCWVHLASGIRFMFVYLYVKDYLSKLYLYKASMCVGATVVNMDSCQNFWIQTCRKISPYLMMTENKPKFWSIVLTQDTSLIVLISNICLWFQGFFHTSSGCQVST